MQGKHALNTREWIVVGVMFLVGLGCQSEKKPPADQDFPSAKLESAETVDDETKPNGREVQGLPPGWILVDSPGINQQQAAAIGQKLGGSIEQLVNAIYTVDGDRFQVNTITCAETSDANRIAATLRKVHGGAHYRVLQEKRQVLEFVTEDPQLVERAYHDLGLVASTVRYRVRFQAAPLKKISFMSWNALFNALSQGKEDRARGLAADCEFGKSISLRVVGQGGQPSSLQVSPAASGQVTLPGGSARRYEFAEPRRRYGFPVIDVEMEVVSQGFALTPADAGARGMTGPTDYWPTESRDVAELAARIFNQVEGTASRVRRLLDWFRSGANMRYAGTTVGSRYGVEQVLKQRHGHCWDFADLFITLARAGGVPCRQVYGWLYGSSGHVWVEVLTEAGWRAVDPTAGMGCDSRYIPIFHSSDGMIDLVYASYPEIKILEGP